MFKGLHPLINRDDSAHYDNSDKESAIYLMEKELSIREMIGFVHGNIFKYKYRMDAKGQKESDARKIGTYVAYMNALYDLLNHGIDEELSVHRAWVVADIQWDY